MYGEWMNDDFWQEIEREENKRLKEEFELEEKIFRISHPVLAKAIDIKDKFASWLLRL